MIYDISFNIHMYMIQVKITLNHTAVTVKVKDGINPKSGIGKVDM